MKNKNRNALTTLALISNKNLKKTDWYVDSGASEHNISNNKEWLNKYALNEPIKIKIGMEL